MGVLALGSLFDLDRNIVRRFHLSSAFSSNVLVFVVVDTKFVSKFFDSRN
jgi:hypothetical protein